MELKLLVAEPWPDYGLVDSGAGRKLERYGAFRFIRPEPQALWAPASADWQADGEFVGGSDEDGGGRWRLDARVPQAWPLARGDVSKLPPSGGGGSMSAADASKPAPGAPRGPCGHGASSSGDGWLSPLITGT